MEKDSYPRFLKSNIYLNLLNDLQANSLKWLVPAGGNYRWYQVQKECTGMAPWGNTLAFLDDSQIQGKNPWLRTD